MEFNVTAPLKKRIREAKDLGGSTPDVAFLNQVFSPLGPLERIHLLYAYFQDNEVLVTSSFGTKSVFLLHILHLMRPTQKVYFIDTSYHFPETIAYKEELIRRLGLQIEDVHPNPEENALTREEEWWKLHPRMCCSINKIAPLEPIKAAHKVWISGLMAYQTEFRSRLQVFEQQGDILKFHPLIDLSEETFEQEMKKLDLPRHPLEDEGYGSIGCTHCTDRGEGRSGRWKATGQTECGLHPGFFDKRKL
ncbi:MAG: phosphoadenylyl-sulfate reductase [Saprospirales bacterium]|nr:phosphoadenylyl-sulfate reductase [Saprospirales bacterium]MBK6904086.1 phosphoadenylyl-sulfate reductase [Saprospirales bacterium]MBK7335862.1 phosphoadenylyl-sulfate reductase [Saprospirales bacterium]